MIDVLISGAGAAGLTLAIDLARRGVSFRLIDRLDVPFSGSRGKGIQPRTLEVFEDLGIVDRIAAAGSKYPPQRLHRGDDSYRDEQNMALEAPIVGEPYRTPLLIPQFLTELAMRNRLAELGGAPEYGLELIGFEQTNDSVEAQVDGANGKETIVCRYLVGADGGRSVVRHALGVEFPGKTLGIRAIVADISLDGLPRDAWHRFNDGDMARQISFCPLPHGDVFQLQAPISHDGDMELSVEALQSFIDSRLPIGKITVRDVAWASCYSMNARLAERYRVGRVILVGDAAHIHPPTGGQGLNTSVQDAYNLGWKLDGVLSGAPDWLLDSYQAERRPIAAGMLGLATGLLEKARHGDMRRGREVHQLDVSYESSQVSLRTSKPDALLIAGSRAPDASIRGAAGQPARVFNLLKGPHWTLLGYEVGGGTVSSRQGLHVHTIGAGGDYHDDQGHFSAIYALKAGDWVLVRPDGYIAGTAASDGLGALESHLSAVGVV
ncbi:FAD-dependent oxidoreductase [Rhizobium sp. X9]|uniref:FAD-dependent oxidoreductase n=1 Tax=Rhizobium sp. X9 TaxID=2815360 RepID=UPI001C0C7A0F|nr:FAD-dependent oxidoreductase [Rhizobium sp. X9]